MSRVLAATSRGPRERSSGKDRLKILSFSLAIESVTNPLSANKGVDMALPLLKLMDMTGPFGFPETVVLLQVLQQGGGGRVRMGRLTMERNDELMRNLFVFDDQTFRSFENPLQFRIVVADDDGRDLGETIIDANDANDPRDELFIKFLVNGIIGGPFYELGYRVIAASEPASEDFSFKGEPQRS
jgi:hypothetical protein